MNRKVLFFLLFCIAMCITTGLLTRNYGTFYLADSYEYLDVAEGDYGPFTKLISSDSELKSTKRPFFYPMLLWVFGVNKLLIIQNILLLLVLYRMFNKLNIAKATNSVKFLSLIIFTLAAWNIFIYANKVMSEIILLTCIWFLVELHQSELGAKRQFLFVVLFVLLPFIKPVFYLFPLFLFPFFLFRKFRSKTIFLAMISAIVVNAIYIGYNYQRNGVAEFSSIQHINLLNYNYLYWESKNTSHEEAVEKVDSLNLYVQSMTYPDKVSEINHFVLDEIKQRPLSYLMFHITGGAIGAIEPGRFDVAGMAPKWVEGKSLLTESKGSKMDYLRSFGIGAVIILGFLTVFNGIRFLFASFFVLKNIRKLTPEMLLAVAFVSYLIMAAGAINASRFMTPVVPLLIFYAVKGSESLFNRKKNKSIDE